MSTEQGRPKVKGVGDIKSLLLNPATTSHFYVHIALPTEINPGYLASNNLNYDSEVLSLMCCEATLPGSNMATLEVNGDFHGVTERHAYRRVYDDRIDLTFYVDAQNYMSIRVFELWMKFIAQESADTPQADRGSGRDTQNREGSTSRSPSYFYRFNYPNNYISNDMIITKFERSSPLRTADPSRSLVSTGGGFLTYSFMRVYPISISSIPVSYDSSQLLKCTVSMSYIRYILNTPDAVQTPPPEASLAAATPAQQADYNSTLQTVSQNLSGTNLLGSPVGGVSQAAANASGNSVFTSESTGPQGTLAQAYQNVGG